MKRPIRVLHVIGSLSRGGTETWLINVMRRIDSDEFATDFLVQAHVVNGYEGDARELRANVILCARDVWWPFRLARILKSDGPYDIIHSHRNQFSAFVLLIAKAFGGSARLVAHNHAVSSRVEGRQTIASKMVRGMSRFILNHLADLRLATSGPSAVSLFGPLALNEPDVDVIHAGIDIDAFVDLVPGRTQRHDIGISDDALVIGHVGAFKYEKNHDFLLDVFLTLINKHPNSHLVLIGTGPLESSLTQRAMSSGIESKIHFLGSRSDVPQLMQDLMDVFVFPSRREGLGMAVIEAQLSGLPCVISTAVPAAAQVFPDLVTGISTNSSIQTWVEKILQVWLDRSTEVTMDRSALMKGTDLDIDESVRNLLDHYRRLIAG